MTVSAYDKAGDCLTSKTYFSVGGGFVVEEGETDAWRPILRHPIRSIAPQSCLSNARKLT